MSQWTELFRKWLAELNPRERQLVIAGMVFLLAFIPYQFIWVPFNSGLDQLQDNISRTQKDLEEIKMLASEASQLQSASGVRVSDGNRQSLLTLVVNSTRKYLKGGVENTKEDGKSVRVRLKDASFDELMLWLDNLQSAHGVLVKEVALERLPANGRVNGKVVLEQQ